MDDFYIGYSPATPSGLAGRVRKIAAVLLFVVLTTALALITSEAPLDPSSFEYAHEQTFTGVVRSTSLPMIALDNGSPAVLVGAGKHGYTLPSEVRIGTTLTLRGKRIERDGNTMIEVASAPQLGGQVHPVQPVSQSRIEVRGEIVDTKCYNGVMNPGQGKTHKSCAARCLHGGIPVGLVTRDGSLYYLLDSARQPLSADWSSAQAGRYLRVQGDLSVRDGLRTLAVTNVTSE